eukprot:8890601-Ditylum_brightwellii.AAC.1
MVDWEGNMTEKKNCMRILVEDLPDVDEEMTMSSVISSLESLHIDKIFEQVEPKGVQVDLTCVDGKVHGVDYVYTKLSGISNIFDPGIPADSIHDRRNAGAFASSIGSTSTEGNIGDIFGESGNMDGMMGQFYAYSTSAKRTLDVATQYLQRSERLHSI